MPRIFPNHALSPAVDALAVYGDEKNAAMVETAFTERAAPCRIALATASCPMRSRFISMEAGKRTGAPVTRAWATGRLHRLAQGRHQVSFLEQMAAKIPAPVRVEPFLRRCGAAKHLEGAARMKGMIREAGADEHRYLDAFDMRRL